MAEAVILEAVRTPFGRRGGVLRDIRPDKLLAHTLDGLAVRAGIDPEKIEDVVTGAVTQAGEQGANVGRLAVMLAGFPVTVPAVSINRMCGSSQQAVHFTSQAIAAGDMSYAIGCGVESMTRAPMFSDIGEAPDAGSVFQALNPELLQKQELIHQGESAERIADEWRISREDIDALSAESHHRAAAAPQEGRELLPISGLDPEGNPVEVERDEGVRANVDPEKMDGLKTVFRPEDGVVTAGNSSQISDGASAVLVGGPRNSGGRRLPSESPFPGAGGGRRRPSDAAYRRHTGDPAGVEKGRFEHPGPRLDRDKRSLRHRRPLLGRRAKARHGQSQSVGRCNRTRTPAGSDRRGSDGEDGGRPRRERWSTRVTGNVHWPRHVHRHDHRAHLVEVQGYTFLVTGGGSGLGAATARSLTESGAKVLVADLNEEAGERVAQEIGDATRFVKTDVTDEKSTHAAIDTAVHELGGLHGVVNCAGVAIGEKVLGKNGPARVGSIHEGAPGKRGGDFQRHPARGGRDEVERNRPEAPKGAASAGSSSTRRPWRRSRARSDRPPTPHRRAASSP